MAGDYNISPIVFQDILGPIGIQGSIGAWGPTGLIGPQGAVGPQGIPGFTSEQLEEQAFQERLENRPF